MNTKEKELRYVQFTYLNSFNLLSELYKYIIDECKKKIDIVETGVFGADMKVELLNDGPVTIILDCNGKNCKNA